jgi:hypothetical protein
VQICTLTAAVIRINKEEALHPTVRRNGQANESRTPRNRVLIEKLTGLQLVKKFPAFY